MKKLFVLSIALFSLVSCSDDNGSNIAPIEKPTASTGTIFGSDAHPLNVGGSNHKNQVYVDLSEETAMTVSRDSWDLGFYSGDDFRVVINGSLGMAVKKMETTDISLTQTIDATVTIGNFDPGNMAYIDNPSGNLSNTAFGTIATSEAEANVFLVNMGRQVPTVAAATGSTNVAGPVRGWKKVRVWKDGAGYKVQYADLDAATAQTVTITKNAAYNHVFFSFTTNAVVQAEPQKDKWDLNFTTFTNEVFQDTESAGAYFYSDYIVSNSKAGVTAYKVEGASAAFEAFSLNDVNTALFSSDQRAIGSDWRNVIPVQVYDNVFFVLKDGSGNTYKIKFISMLNAAGERGFPVFEYKLLE